MSKPPPAASSCDSPTRTLRDALLDNYRYGQGRISSRSAYVETNAFWSHYDSNYSDLLATVSRKARVIDVGCGPGTLLSWLRAEGFTRIEGVDMSPGDVDFAASHLGPGVVTLGDGVTHLSAGGARYDVVILKALLEHLPKDRLLDMAQALAAALTPAGVVIVEVPNMDWLIAAHERYLDLTHEVGFTRESLESLLMLTFEEVEVRGSRLSSLTRSQRWARRPLVALLRRLLYVLGEGASDTLFAHRSLVAVARTPRRSH